MPDPVDLREQLSAYLAGELDEAAVAQLEARMAAEPWVAHEADRMAELLVGLGRPDEVDVPRGLGERLRSGLAAELGHDLPDTGPDGRSLVASGAAAATGWAEAARAPGSRGPAGTRPGDRASRRRSRTTAVLAAVAAVAVLFVAGVSVVVGGFGSSGESEDAGVAAVDEAADADRSAPEGASALQGAATEAAGGEQADTAAAEAEEPAGEDSAVAADPFAGGTADESAAGAPVPTSAASEDAAATGVVDGPAVLDLPPLPDAGSVRDVVAGDPAATELLGRPADAAEELALAYRDEVLRSPDRTDGSPAGACLVEVLETAGGDLVPAVAAAAELPDGPVVAFALVRSAGGDVLDTVDVWLVDPSSCTVRQVLSGE